MLARRMIYALMMLSMVWLFSNCQEEELMMRNGRKGGGGHDVTITSDDGSDFDRPDWAGGNTDANIHSKGNDETGVPKGVDYGDLYMLRGDNNGVPGLIQIGDSWYVQPIDEFGNPLELNEEGELVDPEAATEVEFGILNLVRSPQSVLDAGLAEALVPLTADGAVITLDHC